MEAPRVDDADLDLWRDLWNEDRRIPMPSKPGLLGKLLHWGKRLLRPMVVSSQADLWERQRRYNQLIQHHLYRTKTLEKAFTTNQEDTWRQINSVQETFERGLDEHFTYIEGQDKRILRLEEVQKDGLDDLARHHDAAFAVVDTKLDSYRQRSEEVGDQHKAVLAVLDAKFDRYRRETVRLQAQLVSFIRLLENQGPSAVAEALNEEEYVELERRHRGTEKEIAERVEPYLPFLGKAHSQHVKEGDPGLILDLGCGRGEALEVFKGRGWAARGIDLNSQMVEQCRSKGLEAQVGDLFEALSETPSDSLTGVVSFHVIEHLSHHALERLVLLAWRALRPGGFLVVETPSPLSVIVGARNFWLDPTHQRPVHPDSLALTFESAGFEAVERIDRQPFAEDHRLPEIETKNLSGDLLNVAHEINLLRDQLDDLLYGFQDFGMVGRKP